MPAPPAQPDQAPDFPTSGSRGGRPRIPGRLAAAFSLGKTGMDSGIGDGTGASEPVPVPPGHREWGAGAGQGREPGAWGCVGFWGIPPFFPSTSQRGFNPFLHPQAILVPPSVFLPGTGITSGRAGTKDDFRSTFILPLFFFFLLSCWLFFILHFSHPGLLSPPPPHPEELEFHPSLRALWEVWSHARCLPVGAGNGVGLHQIGN